MTSTPVPSSSSTRSLPLDALKAFAIFLVCWGHGIQYLSSTPYQEQPIYRLIYSFHMPLFMAMVGYFAQSMLKRNLWEGIWRRFQQLIVPAWSFLVLLLLTGFASIDSFGSLYLHLVFDLWFLKSAFVCSVLFAIFAKNRRFRILGILISLCISQCTSALALNVMYPSFILGVFLRRYSDSILARKKLIGTLTAAIFLLMLIPWDERFWHREPVTFDPSCQYFMSYWCKTIYRIAIGAVATTALFCLFHSFHIDNWRFRGGVLAIGQHTLGIYLIQNLLLERILSAHLCFDDASFFSYNFIITPLISIGVLLVCMVIINIIKHSRIASYIILGKQMSPA